MKANGDLAHPIFVEDKGWMNIAEIHKPVFLSGTLSKSATESLLSVCAATKGIFKEGFEQKLWISFTLKMSRGWSGWLEECWWFYKDDSRQGNRKEEGNAFWLVPTSSILVQICEVPGRLFFWGEPPKAMTALCPRGAPSKVSLFPYNEDNTLNHK